MTVYEKIKELSIPEMATLIAQMVDHESNRIRCECPIGACEMHSETEGHCGLYQRGCDESALEWLKSEDELYIDVPEYLLEDEEEAG